MIQRSLSDKERVDWLRLSRTDKVGPVTFVEIMKRYGWDAAAALDGLPSLSNKAGANRNLEPLAADALNKELDQGQKLGVRHVAICEPGYPEALAAIDHAPPVISVRGNLDALQKPAIAIIGARNASAAGRKLARDIARPLSEEGFCIVSGLARGIDGEAHAGALDGGSSSTIAVLAGGVDNVFPKEHQSLYDRILEHGAIVSERPLGFVGKAKDFPRRNRLIAGLSLGVLVVEAASRSGSLITSRLALEQGREVMAVPGSPLDSRTSGSNGLIKQGAWLIETAQDVMNALEGSARTDIRQVYSRQPDEPVQIEIDTPLIDQIRTSLSPTPVSLQEIVNITQRPIREVLAALTELELSGIATTHAGGAASLRTE